MKSPDSTNVEHWHRYFGASANNEAWGLAELPADEIDRRALLDAAHAAAWHWKQVGTELNRMRAFMLLAAAHARADLGTSAFAYAEEIRRYFLGSAATPDWETAFTHVVHAHAACAAGKSEQHAQSYRAALEAVARIADDEDREIVQRVLRHVPAP